MKKRDFGGRFLKGVKYSEKTQFQKGQHWRQSQPFWEKDWLQIEYVDKQRSTAEIAAEFGVTDANVVYFLKKHEIARRSISEARKVKHWGASGDKNPMFGKMGKLNPRYIDGSSPERQRIYAQHEWKELIKRVYERDGFKCQRCNVPHTRKNTLHAHHIKAWAKHPELRAEPSNLITLCKSCHDFVHSKANTKKEFL